MSLREYIKKRNFEKTPEPGGNYSTRNDKQTFVVQKHNARALHYDFRLYYEGVLLSWAVPKGPTLNPDEKRLAIRTEDHPAEYENFEGIIPEGNYGAGSVLVWDKGSYERVGGKDMKEMLKNGHISVILRGEKLRGEFALVSIKKSEKNWLMIKKRDQYASKKEVREDERSVLSGLKNNELESKRSEIWGGGGRVNLPGVQPSPMPHKIKPMLAEIADKPFSDPDWIFEIKWDGYRAIAEIENDQIKLYSRNLKDFTRKFLPIAQDLKKLKDRMILDGEVVFLAPEGKPLFEELQNYPRVKVPGLLVFMVFDLLFFSGRSLFEVALIKRKQLLKNFIPPNLRHIRYSDHTEGEGIAFFDHIQSLGVEGIMAKRRESRYCPGERSSQWLKIKMRKTLEAVIAGFAKPDAGRQYFSSLILGQYSGKDLVYVGNVGSGFSFEKLREIAQKLKEIEMTDSPFGAKIKIKEATWVKPIYVCEVEYAGLTRDHYLRQPVFKRMREDINPKEVLLA